MKGNRKKLIDLTGQRFGRLTVLYRAEENKTANALKGGAALRPRWVCKCDCGETTTVIGANLRAGMTKSCGCLRRETSAENGRKRRARKKRKSMGEAKAAGGATDERR